MCGSGIRRRVGQHCLEFGGAIQWTVVDLRDSRGVASNLMNFRFTPSTQKTAEGNGAAC